MTQNLRNKRVLLVSNLTDLSGPTEGLESFLINKVKLLATIYHPFFYCHDKRSKANLYSDGKIKKSFISRDFKLPEFIKYLFDQILNIYYSVRFGKHYDIFIGVNCLHAFLGLIYKKIGLTKTVIFYTIDWMPQRFSNRIINRFYFLIDKIAYTHADFVWNLSEDITDVRKRQGVSSKKNLLVPNGLNTEEIKNVPLDKINRQSLVLLGALHESKGVDLVIESLPAIWEKFPKVKLIVIGLTPQAAGIKPYEKILSALGDRVKILGALKHEKILELLPTFGIGLSPYSPDAKNLSRYAWPARVIDYLACGLPVIITPVPKIAYNISENKAGILISYNKDELIEAVYKLLTDDKFYFNARLNAREMVSLLSWENIFQKAFIKIL